MSTAKQLEEALGQKLDRRETTSDWRGGFLYIWSPVMSRFVQRQMVAVRPHEDLSGCEREAGGLIALIDR